MRKIVDHFKPAVALALAAILVFAAIPGRGSPALAEVSAEPSFDEMLEQLRAEHFSPFAPFALSDIEEIHLDDSARIHTPPAMPLLENAPNIQPLAAWTPPSPYSVNQRRSFPNSMGAYATLVRQNARVNIWVIDPATPGQQYMQTLLNPANAQVLNGLLASFTQIVNRMIFNANAPFGGFQNVLNYVPHPSIPRVGDLHGDGRINVLLYDHGGGFFHPMDFFTVNGNSPIAIFHVGVARLIDDLLDPNIPQPSQNALNSIYDTFAHELAHLLFFMHFGMYTLFIPGRAQEYLWFDEALAELAGKYFAVAGGRLISFGRTRAALEIDYYNPNDSQLRPGDFLNFNNSLKNYGMSRLYFSMMNRLADNLVRDLFSFFAYTFPPSTNGSEFWANDDVMLRHTMPEMVGNALAYAGLTASTGATGETAFNLLYFLFMENFAADGGRIYAGNNFHQTAPFHQTPYSAHNLWGIRPTLGQPVPGVFPNYNILFFDAVRPYGARVDDYAPIPAISPGGNIVMWGYAIQNPIVGGATHDRLYRLYGGQNMGGISISIPDNSINTRFYAVIPNEPWGARSSSNNMRFGQHGAQVFALNGGGVNNVLPTDGRPVYLFIITLFRNVNTTVNFEWQENAPAPPGCGSFVCSIVRTDTITNISGAIGPSWNLYTCGTLVVGGGHFNTNDTFVSQWHWSSWGVQWHNYVNYIVYRIIFTDEITIGVNWPALGAGQGIFGGLTDLQTIEGLYHIIVLPNIQGVPPRRDTQMGFVFRNTRSLESLDLTHWNMSAVFSTVDMFYNSGVSYLNIDDWDLSHVRFANSMFARMYNMPPYLDLSGLFGCREVVDQRNFAGMFNGSHFERLNLSGWDVRRVTNFNSMFLNMPYLTHLDLSGWDTHYPRPHDRTMTNMFAGAVNLRELVLGEDFRFVGDAGLPDVPGPANSLFTGFWQNVGNGTVYDPQGEHVFTSAELMADNYGANTWVWQPRRVTIEIIAPADNDMRVWPGRELRLDVVVTGLPEGRHCFVNHTLGVIFDFDFGDGFPDEVNFEGYVDVNAQGTGTGFLRLWID